MPELSSIGELHIDTVIRNLRSAPSRRVGPVPTWVNDQDDTASGPALPWSRQQAEAWRRSQPSTSPWRVVAAQALAGAACVAVVSVFSGSAASGVGMNGVVASSLWGAACAVLPSALLARGMTRRRFGNPMVAAVGALFWIMVKIGVACLMLAIASRVVPNPSWPALLATMFVCIKINWIALLGRGRRPARPAAKA